jgi:uncharacterized protein involved in outer membrane biogenesis
MKSNKWVARIIKSLLFIAVTLVLLQSVLSYIDISFTSDKARRILIEQITTFTQRDAHIDGEVKITISLLPEVLVERIHIKNTEGFGKEDFITVTEVRVQASLFPLITGNLHLEEFTADQAHISLIHKKDGSNNWSFDHLIKSPDSASKEDGKDVQQISQSRLSFDVFRLTDIIINYKDESDDQVVEKYIKRIIVDLEDKEIPRAEITGSLQGYPYNITLESGSLNDLASGQLWKLGGSGSIADRKTSINTVIKVNKNIIEGNIDINIQDISLGLLLEHIGIITGEDAACEQLSIKASVKGEDLADLIKKAEIELQLERGFWKWHALLKDEIRQLTFNKAALRASWNKPIELHLDGKLFNEVIQLDINTNRLSEFFDDIYKLDVDLKARVAESDIALKGTLDLPVKKKRFQLDISLKGKGLEKLNRILDSELPPFNDYRLSGSISSNEKGFIVKADDASIGDTHFKTTIIIETGSFKPFWTINLNSRQLQIKDFEFVESNIEMPDAAAIIASLKQAGGDTKEEPGRHLKQIVDDPKMHFDLNLKAEKVLAGESTLGGSSLKMKLRDDTLIIQDAELNVPGGKIKSTASFKVNDEQVTGALKLDIDKFEYGAVVRYFIPGSLQDGVINTRIDLKLGGRDFSRLFDKATGKLDLALWPGNTKTQVFDIWATNLFLLILPEIRKKESRVNCIVALMDLEDGIMKEDFFGIDTTKVWMHGNINVDFANEYVVLSLYPRSKTARLFAVQAPIRAQGNFDDIRLITNPVDIAAAYVSFITSPLHVPARRVFGDKVPADASAVCKQFYDREYVRKLKLIFEAEEQKEIDEWLDTD